MLWIKCFHVLFVMSWMAGVFYLPRIFVHYAEGSAAGEDVRRLRIMATRLYAFMTIMAVIALILGIWLWRAYDYHGRWLQWKLVFVFALLVYHFYCRHLVDRMRHEQPLPRALVLRFLNEGALLIVVPILILAVVKPFG